MPYVFNPFNGSLDNVQSTFKGDSTYTTVSSNSANWQGTYTNFSTNSATYVKTVATTTPGTSAVTTIVAVSALPLIQEINTLYILV